MAVGNWISCHFTHLASVYCSFHSISICWCPCSYAIKSVGDFLEDVSPLVSTDLWFWLSILFVTK